MKLEIYTIEDQARGHFNNGEILENKPIGFPGDGGKLKPYSNIFYWAHAWTGSKKSTIGLHPHQGFEICSFVLKGKINHFDTKQNSWIPLSEGDVQIIRSGNGISHSEELMENSEIFQIWFDPNLRVSLNKLASYDDYKSQDFQILDSKWKKTKIIKNENSRLKMDSEGIEIFQYSYLDNKNDEISLKLDKIHSFFIIDGEISINGKIISKGFFFTVRDQNLLKLKILSNSEIFRISSPKNVSYKTYS
ncbi:MAG: pirin family protein [Bacteroidota bacterium]|nr:pirin family protein [Bacteroidota bacterium]|tara:strand:+ start:1897 stop:2640 length:744 start_codon:yes stop_codon:yes gene_type:complete